VKRIVLIKSRLDRSGGAEKYAWRLLTAFLKESCRVTLLTSGKVSSPLPAKDLIIHSLHSKKKLSFRQVRAFDRFCLRHCLKNETILGLDRTSFQTHLRASNGVHAAYLHHRSQGESLFRALSFSLNPLHRTLLKIEKNSFTHPALQKIIVNSHLVKRELLSYYPVDEKKVVVVHNGVEWEEKRDAFDSWKEGRENALARFNLSPHSFHLLFLGHNFRRKGLEPLLRGLALLLHEEIHLSVVGRDKQEGYFRNLVKTLRLENRVSFFKQQTDTTPFYQLADALAIPSWYDPFANVTVEALSMGVYLLSSKTNGGHEVVKEGCGSLFPSLTSNEAVALALKQALSHPKTEERARQLRYSVKELDFSIQLPRITRLCLA